MDVMLRIYVGRFCVTSWEKYSVVRPEGTNVYLFSTINTSSVLHKLFKINIE